MIKPPHSKIILKFGGAGGGAQYSSSRKEMFI